ncbi:GGDEF domain-containing protein [Alteromonas facilis]|uniref:GGDEF domain-containing protein n=1 Tax=Alteromonas facilis TaxID=2048004 RepID=UPI000C291E28|nr:sensor domain-containing diguanylate cyclase [Alteromonas facilis]
MNIEQLKSLLDALPDPAFLLSASGKYIAVFGGRDSRYYHDGSSLVGQKIHDVLNQEKADWFVSQIQIALTSVAMHIVEYELSDKDVKGLPDVGPSDPIWFEGRLQSLKFNIDDEPVVLWVASNISARHQLEESLRHLSETDQLTGLYNRRKLERDMSMHFANFKRYDTPTSLLMLDLDNLKQLNDNLGHKMGDQMILALAETCKAELRQTDIACRFGGDEFVIVLPNTIYEQAIQFAERLRLAFEQKVATLANNVVAVSVSIGATTLERSDTSHEDALHRADNILYQAKQLGKNCVANNSTR